MFLFISLHINCREKDTLMIRYSDWDRQPIHVSTCSNFEVTNGFENEYIIPPEFADSLKSLLNNQKAIEDFYFPISCKLYFFRNDTVCHKVCMNRNYLIQNGRTYINNDTIVNFINNLIGRFPPNENSNNRFLPNVIGAGYIGGIKGLYDTLQKELNRMSTTINYSGTMIMNIRCKANKEGYTTHAEVKIAKPLQPSQKEYEIACSLSQFIKDNIIWNQDCDRNNYDNIIFSLRFRSPLITEK